mgnify:CR=1 FL=1
METLHLALLLVFGHYLGDYGLQSAYMAAGKNRHDPNNRTPWFHPLFAHCAIHSGFVYLATGSVTLALAELAAHFVIDDTKCRGWFGEGTDQALHLFCKAVWLALLVSVPALSEF